MVNEYSWEVENVHGETWCSMPELDLLAQESDRGVLLKVSERGNFKLLWWDGKYHNFKGDLTNIVLIKDGKIISTMRSGPINSKYASAEDAIEQHLQYFTNLPENLRKHIPKDWLDYQNGS